jgi:hypothetical protein
VDADAKDVDNETDREETEVADGLEGADGDEAAERLVGRVATKPSERCR